MLIASSNIMRIVFIFLSLRRFINFGVAHDTESVYFFMVRQKMISVKLDVDQLALLDDLCSSIGCNRNKLINFAVKMLNSNMDGVSFRRTLLVSAYQTALSDLLRK